MDNQPEYADSQKIPFADADFLVKARVAKSEIQMIVKFIEGLGHMGVVTTSNRFSGEVIIQTTRYCWPDLNSLLERMPFEVEILEFT